jgi:ADP-ribose pyrophosphatase
MASYNNLISQKPVFKSRYFKIVEDKIKTPNGEIHIHHNIHRAKTSIIFPVTNSYEVYLIKQYRYLYSRYIFEAVAGYVEKGETPLSNAKKELVEEAGIIAGSWKELRVVSMGGSLIKGQTYIFLAQDLKFASPKRESDEQIEVIKMSLDQALDLVLNQKVITASAILGLLLLDKMRREGKL